MGVCVGHIHGFCLLLLSNNLVLCLNQVMWFFFSAFFVHGYFLNVNTVSVLCYMGLFMLLQKNFYQTWFIHHKIFSNTERKRVNELKVCGKVHMWEEGSSKSFVF